jgi:predicted phage tail protein
VTVLVDGQIAQTVTAGSNGAFTALLEEIARGAYTFGIYATDPSNVRSSTFSTSFTVTGARTTALSNINVVPTIKVSPDPVTPPAGATISGFAFPSAAVTIEVERDKSASSRKTYTASSSSDGSWSIPLASGGLANGTYKTRARAVGSGGLVTAFSAYTLFGVGQSADRGGSADLNSDGKVNLTDFSILLFWWNTAGGSSNPPADINGDGRVTLTDFSIMLFNWTG